MEENQIVNPNAEGQEQAAAQPAEGATATTNVPVQEPVAETVAAHDDFDWSIDKRNVASYSK
jgi:small subunit ribosomal protein S1